MPRSPPRRPPGRRRGLEQGLIYAIPRLTAALGHADPIPHGGIDHCAILMTTADLMTTAEAGPWGGGRHAPTAGRDPLPGQLGKVTVTGPLLPDSRPLASRAWTVTVTVSPGATVNRSRISCAVTRVPLVL